MSIIPGDLDFLSKQLGMEDFLIDDAVKNLQKSMPSSMTSDGAQDDNPESPVISRDYPTGVRAENNKRSVYDEAISQESSAFDNERLDDKLARYRCNVTLDESLLPRDNGQSFDDEMIFQ